MKQNKMLDFPAAVVTLSKALETHKVHRGTYAKYAPVKRVQCDECINVLHEAKGAGQPPPRREAFTPHPGRHAAAVRPPQRSVAGHRRRRRAPAAKA